MGLNMKVAALANRNRSRPVQLRLVFFLRKEGIRHEHGMESPQASSSIELIPNFSSNPNPKILQSRWIKF